MKQHHAIFSYKLGTHEGIYELSIIEAKLRLH